MRRRCRRDRGVVWSCQEGMQQERVQMQGEFPDRILKNSNVS